MKRSSKWEPTGNAKPIPHIPLPFEEVVSDVLKIKPPTKAPNAPNHLSKSGPKKRPQKSD